VQVLVLYLVHTTEQGAEIIGGGEVPAGQGSPRPQASWRMRCAAWLGSASCPVARRSRTQPAIRASAVPGSGALFRRLACENQMGSSPGSTLSTGTPYRLVSAARFSVSLTSAALEMA
jgi:hypothetical protein